VGHPHAAALVHHGLYALQHRGQESAGITACNQEGTELVTHRGTGLLSDVFSGYDLNCLQGEMAIGHVRYSTTGESSLLNAQPLVVQIDGHSVALGHNGNLVNAAALRRKLETEGSIFQTSSDTEVIAHLTARAGEEGIGERLRAALRQVRGAYGLVFLTPKALYAARDPHGLRPLCLGHIEGAWMVASETCALDAVGAQFEREVKPGEFLYIGQDQMHSSGLGPESCRCTPCIFEHIYFARPDSKIGARNAHQIRKKMGQILAREHPIAADLVSGVPDSSLSAASGYAEEAGLPYEMSLVRNRYVGRTFIQPGDELRRLAVRLKFNPLEKVVQGRRLILVDDSVVRGTTSRALIQLLREAGAEEIHLRITSPPYRHPCYYGINTSCRSQLIAAGRSVGETGTLLGADSLRYLSIEGTAAAAGGTVEQFCTACFSGEYPVPVAEAGGSRS